LCIYKNIYYCLFQD